MMVFDRAGSPITRATQKQEGSGQVCTGSRYLPSDLPGPPLGYPTQVPGENPWQRCRPLRPCTLGSRAT